MAVTKTTLELYKNITAGSDDKTQSFTPSIGYFYIVLINAEAAFDMNVAVRVDFNGSPVWLTKGSSQYLEHIKLLGDGIKKIELVLDANDLPNGSVFIGGIVKIEQVV